MSDIAELWDIEPGATYLNHGSFGPAPRPVRNAFSRWNLALERQPMRFFCQEMEEYLQQTTETLAKFVGSKPQRLALVDNATFAMNVAAQSIDLQPSDEVLLTNHEYGAVRNIWSDRCRRAGAGMLTVDLPFPPADAAVVASVEAAITDRTRVIVISHVTSPTACILPVAEICQVAKRHEIIVCVDGPHAVAMLDLQLDKLGCDFYCASCHKWLCAPLGSGFLWVHPRHHAGIQSPVISWGGSISGRPASWQDRLNWQGTRNPAALLAIADAIHFFDTERLQQFRQHSHQLVSAARSELLQMSGVTSFCTPTEADFVSMAAVELPRPSNWKPGYHGHADALQLELRDRHQIEVPVASWNGRRFLRVSAHLYNTMDDVDRLLNAVRGSTSFGGS